VEEFVDKLSDGRSSPRSWGIVILLLLVFFAQLAFGARRLSLTSDEPSKLGAGYTYLTTGETWQVPSHGHPPLIVAWIALPVVLGNPHISLQTLPNWHTDILPPYFRALLPLLGPVEQLEVAGRVPVMLLGLLLAGLVFRWAADLFGHKGGLLALALMVFDPTMVAHAQLATVDVGVTLLGFATFFVGWRWAQAQRTPTQDLWWSIGIGLLAGATIAAKVSGLIWVALAVGAMAVVKVRRSVRSVPRVLGVILRNSVTIAIVAFLFLWGIYRFQVGPLHVGSHLLTVPASYHWKAMLQQATSTSGRLMFLAGETRLGEGWWWYFPFAFLIKNPVPLLLMWIGAAIVSLRRRSLTLLDSLFLFLFPAVYLAMAIYSEFNIGYRHLLPIHPFLYVAAAQWVDVGLAVARWRQRKLATLARVLWGALWIWYVAGTLRMFPHYLAYFNELVGGPRNGYRYLVDSNLDWGQSFKVLKETLEHLDVRLPLRLGHYWYAGPELYGIQYEPIPPFADDVSIAFSPRFDPPPGTYVLGATLLQRGSGDLEQYEWFRHHVPIAQPGYALFVYRVDPHQPPATWIAQCLRPAPPLDDSLIAREFYSQPLRRVYFDCTQSWVYPENGRTSGWYALHTRVLQENLPFLQRHLAQAHLSYVHHQYDAMAPAFRLYEFQPARPLDFARGDVVTYTSAVRVAVSGMSPGQVVTERPVVTAPLQLEGPLTFLGYRLLDARPDVVALETWWQVSAQPTRPLSIMAHLVDGTGRPVAVADGLGVPIEVWQAGDVLVQYHLFSLTPDLREEVYWVQTGVYWLDTLERQEVTGPGLYAGDHILVGEIELVDER
jgi:4-amino-4-deoxy-L-arabinose transferase-like glycosyltransferase